MGDSKTDSINPFIAYTDVLINTTIIMLLFLLAVLLVGRAGNADVRYLKYMVQLEDAVKRGMPVRLAPQLLHHSRRNDPQGTHRWVFIARGKPLFVANTDRLSLEGEAAVKLFARILQQNKDKWRRIRVEGHVKRSPYGDVMDWKLSSLRAITVAETIVRHSDIQFYQISVSGRGSQAPLMEKKPYIPINDRIEIVIEFGHKDALGNDLF